LHILRQVIRYQSGTIIGQRSVARPFEVPIIKVFEIFCLVNFSARLQEIIHVYPISFVF
jgi:hypothetical protein